MARFRQRRELLLYLEQKHEPMRLALIAMFADHPCQMQVRGRKRHTDFLLRLAAGAGVRGFADVHLQFSAARTPKPTIWLLGPFEKQDVVALIEAIEECGDFVGEF